MDIHTVKFRVSWVALLRLFRHDIRNKDFLDFSPGFLIRPAGWPLTFTSRQLGFIWARIDSAGLTLQRLRQKMWFCGVFWGMMAEMSRDDASATSSRLNIGRWPLPSFSCWFTWPPSQRANPREMFSKLGNIPGDCCLLPIAIRLSLESDSFSGYIFPLTHTLPFWAFSSSSLCMKNMGILLHGLCNRCVLLLYFQPIS